MNLRSGPGHEPAKEMFELAVEICPAGIVMVGGRRNRLLRGASVYRSFRRR